MPTSVAEILGEIALRYGWVVRLSRGKIWEVWEEIAGPQVAAHAWPECFRERDTLVVVVSDSVWMQQLSFQGQTLVERLNACLSPRAKIKAIRFVLGDVAGVRSQWVRRKIVKRDVSQKEGDQIQDVSIDMAKDLTAGIRDQELRQAMMDLYLKYRRYKGEKEGNA